MPWLRISDNLHSHPKAEKAGLEAMGFWVLTLSYCGAYLTDGHVPHGAAMKIARSGRRLQKLADELVEAGLWEPHPSGDGWNVHDYLEYNPTKAEALENRAKRADAGRKGAERRWGGSTGTSDGRTAGERASTAAEDIGSNGHRPGKLRG